MPILGKPRQARIYGSRTTQIGILRVGASVAGVAKYCGVSVAICPPRRGNRQGAADKSNHTAAQRWWRSVATDLTVEQAQASPGFCNLRGDTRFAANEGREVVGCDDRQHRGRVSGAAGAYLAIMHSDRFDSLPELDTGTFDSVISCRPGSICCLRALPQHPRKPEPVEGCEII